MEIVIPSHLTPEEEEEELEGFDDFTIATPWERFIAGVEGMLRKWHSLGHAGLVETGMGKMEESMPGIMYVEGEIPYAHKSFRLTYYFPPLAPTRAADPAAAPQSPWDAATHPLQLWFGLKDFLILAPVTASGVVLDSPEASMLLSSLAIAASNADSSLPGFVPVHDPSRKAFVGFQHGPRNSSYGGTDFSFHFEADRLGSHVPNSLLSLDGLYYLFAFKLIAELPSTVASVSPDVLVAMRIRYRIRYWGGKPLIAPNAGGGSGSGSNGNLTGLSGTGTDGISGGGIEGPAAAREARAEEDGAEEEFWASEQPWDEEMVWGDWHSMDDPVKGFEVIATWRELRASSSSGMAQMEQLDATWADEWKLRALLVPVEADSYADEAPGFGGRLHAMLGAYVVSSTAPYIEDFVQAQGIARKPNMAIPPPSVMERVVRDLFPRHAGATADAASGITKEAAANADKEEDKPKAKARHVGKAAPPDSLFSRFALHSLRFGTCNIRAICALWLEFTRELRWYWEEAKLLPHMPTNPGPPDVTTCLAHQKLQLLQECIRRQQQQQQRDLEERMRQAEALHRIAAAKLVGERVDELVRGTAFDDSLAASSAAAAEAGRVGLVRRSSAIMRSASCASSGPRDRKQGEVWDDEESEDGGGRVREPREGGGPAGGNEGRWMEREGVLQRRPGSSQRLQDSTDDGTDDGSISRHHSHPADEEQYEDGDNGSHFYGSDREGHVGRDGNDQYEDARQGFHSGDRSNVAPGGSDYAATSYEGMRAGRGYDDDGGDGYGANWRDDPADGNYGVGEPRRYDEGDGGDHYRARAERVNRRGAGYADGEGPGYGYQDSTNDGRAYREAGVGSFSNRAQGHGDDIDGGYWDGDRSSGEAGHGYREGDKDGGYCEDEEERKRRGVGGKGGIPPSDSHHSDLGEEQTYDDYGGRNRSHVDEYEGRERKEDYGDRARGTLDDDYLPEEVDRDGHGGGGEVEAWNITTDDQDYDGANGGGGGGSGGIGGRLGEEQEQITASGSASRRAEAKVQPSERVRRRGAMKPAEGMWLLNIRRRMYIPYTQDPVYMTEDGINEKERAMEALGESAAGREARARLQSEMLASDMSAFKAANPDAVLEDFVRWHSPNDWIVDGDDGDASNHGCTKRKTGDGNGEDGEDASDSDSLPSSPMPGFHNLKQERKSKADWPPKGRMSERMMEEGNLWQELWDDAEPEPVHEQRPIFHFTLEGEKVLHYFDTLVPEELLSQLLATAFSTAACLLGQAKGADVTPVEKERLRVDKMISSMWQELDDQAAGSCTDERVEDLEVLFTAFERMEASVVTAASLWQRLKGCQRLVEELMLQRSSSTDFPCVTLLPAPLRSKTQGDSATVQQKVDEWEIVGSLFKERQPDDAATAVKKVGGKRMGNLLHKHEPFEREVIFSSPAFAVLRRAPALCSPSASSSSSMDDAPASSTSSLVSFAVDSSAAGVASESASFRSDGGRDEEVKADEVVGYEMVRHQLYAKGSLDHLALALKMASQE